MNSINHSKKRIGAAARRGSQSAPTTPLSLMMVTMRLLLAATAAFFAPALAAAEGPCDIFKAHSTPCVAAHSVVRALYSSYDGPLYQIVRSDKKSMNVTALAAGGYANAAAQEAFCEAGEEGTIGSVAAWSPGGCCAKRLTCLSGMTNASYHPGCVGCATCPAPKSGPTLGKCTITRIFDQVCVLKTPLCAPFSDENDPLPRQARDKHRESTQ